MAEQQYRNRVRYVIGPDGSPLTIADLPPKETKRWVIRRKAEVVAAVRGGLLSLDEACERYKLTVDEFLSWQRSIDRHGLPGISAFNIKVGEFACLYFIYDKNEIFFAGGRIGVVRECSLVVHSHRFTLKSGFC